MAKRQLYQCFKAKVFGDEIRCEVGHSLNTKKRTISINYLHRGKPLEITTCQNCPDFEYMGEPIPSNERGWK
jgi:hypothetical protein